MVVTSCNARMASIANYIQREGQRAIHLLSIIARHAIFLRTTTFPRGRDEAMMALRTAKRDLRKHMREIFQKLPASSIAQQCQAFVLALEC